MTLFFFFALYELKKNERWMIEIQSTSFSCQSQKHEHDAIGLDGISLIIFRLLSRQRLFRQFCHLPLPHFESYECKMSFLFFSHYNIRYDDNQHNLFNNLSWSKLQQFMYVFYTMRGQT